MKKHEIELLQSKFRCGRMLHSQAVEMAGCFAAPMIRD